jgi:hypothetical protein
MGMRGSCGDVVIVTADIDGTVYGALNALCMKNKMGFPASVRTDFSGQTAGQKQDRWCQNWCHPITMTSPGSETLTALPRETSVTGGYR